MKLNCDDITPFIDAYLDGEFEERECAEFEAHLSHCEECRAEFDFQRKFKRQLKQSLAETKAPESLRGNIMALLEEEATQQQAEQTRQTRHSRLRTAGFLGAPLAAALAAVFLLPAFTIAPATSSQLPIVEQTVDWHRGDYPLEVASPEAQDISEWFLGKVDFPVRPPQFHSAKHVELVGARIAHIQDRRAAYVLYDVDGARLSVMMFEGDGLEVSSENIKNIAGTDVALSRANGYEVAVMQNNGVTYTLTTELDESNFVTLMEDALAK